MGNESRNVELLKSAYASWSETKGKSVDRWLDILADDIRFGSLIQGAPAMHYMQAHSTREAVRGYFEGLLSEWEMIRYTVDEFVAQGEAVFMRGSCAWRHKSTGKSVDTPKVDFWRFKDGKAVEFYEYFDTARALAAATA
jgi:ketosteroid isomerase-like protein